MTKATGIHPTSSFWRATHGPLALFRFIVLFAILFLGLQRAYLASRPVTEPIINHFLNAAVGAKVANLVSVGTEVRAEESTLISDAGSVDISKGCEGFEVVLILLAAMAAYPMSWKRRILGMISGSVFIYLLNLVRIVSLYFVISYRSHWFDTAHLGVGQTLMILLAVIYFMVWIDRIPPPGSSVAVPGNPS